MVQVQGQNGGQTGNGGDFSPGDFTKAASHLTILHNKIKSSTLPEKSVQQIDNLAKENPGLHYELKHSNTGQAMSVVASTKSSKSILKNVRIGSDTHKREDSAKKHISFDDQPHFSAPIEETQPDPASKQMLVPIFVTPPPAQNPVIERLLAFRQMQKGDSKTVEQSQQHLALPETTPKKKQLPQKNAAAEEQVDFERDLSDQKVQPLILLDATS